nr:DNA helicase [Tanacetum cinerariifolium]
GGLGLGHLKDKNTSLLGKWKWRFLNEDNALWESIVSNCKDIELLNIHFEKSMIKEVSNGSQAHFWSDIWCKEGKKLMEVFPRLYMLETNKECKLSSFGQNIELVEISSMPCTSIRDISLRKVASIENKLVAKCFHMVCYVAFRVLWHWRNEILHASPYDVDSARQKDIFPSIQRLSFSWISNRCSRTNRQWCGWVSNPREAEGVTTLFQVFAWFGFGRDVGDMIGTDIGVFDFLGNFHAVRDVIRSTKSDDLIRNHRTEIVIGETSEKNVLLKIQCVCPLDSGSVREVDLQVRSNTVGFSECRGSPVRDVSQLVRSLCDYSTTTTTSVNNVGIPCLSSSGSHIPYAGIGNKLVRGDPCTHNDSTIGQSRHLGSPSTYTYFGTCNQVCQHCGARLWTALEKFVDAHVSYFKVRLYNVVEDGYSKEMKLAEFFSASSFGERRLSMKAFYSYYLHDRVNDIRNEYLSGIYDAIVRGDSDGSDVGARLTLPASLTGGPRYMYSHYLDVLAICCVHGNPSFFKTFTCNVKWPQFNEYMEDFPGLTATDMADVVDKVFVSVLYTVDFQKRSLSHCYTLIWIDKRLLMHKDEDIDAYISAELPSKDVDPKCHRVVSELMMHGPHVLSFPNTLNVIVVGADNRPPMLDKTNYSSWASRMLLYIKGKEHGKLLVEFIHNGPFQYETVIEPRNETTPATIRPRTYTDLTDEEKIHESVDNMATNIVFSEPRLILETKQPFKMEKSLFSQFRGDKHRGAYLDPKQLAFLVDNGDTVILAQASQEILTRATLQTDDLDAFDFDCDDVPPAKAVLMANLSSYDSDVFSEVPFHDTNIDDISYQSVQET